MHRAAYDTREQVTFDLSMAQFLNILPGDPAPSFHQRSLTNPRYAFDTAAGRYLILCFVGSVADPHGQAIEQAVRSWTDIFDDEFAAWFGVVINPEDEARKRLQDRYPGIRYFLDFDRTISRAYGAVDINDRPDNTNVTVRRMWVVIDPTLRVLKVIPFADDQSDIRAVHAFMKSLPPPRRFAGIELQAPVLFLPNVLEPELCGDLLAYYRKHGGEESGFMREVDGKTVAIQDHAHKRRADCTIQDETLIGHVKGRIKRRIVPEIAKVHQFHVTRIERYIVACYSADIKGHFRQHRDNTTKGTAHRRFAVSINLNDEFEGGEVRFPEYGPRSFKPPAGGAVVFSCSLLHAVSPVTRGERYAFLPFLYDDPAAEIRQQNLKHLG